MMYMIKYVKESFEELKNNVSVPPFNEGNSLTILVAIFSIVFSLIIWGIDTVFGDLMSVYFNFVS
jgi:preprotein translocase subunit SecE